MRTAEEAGADRLDPQAQLYLKLAKESLDKGKARMEADEHETADRLLRKAEADAELARAIARSVSARAEAEEAKKTVGKIKTVQ